MTTLDLEATAHKSRVLTEWAIARPGAHERMGLVRNAADDSGVILSSDRKILDLFGVASSAAGVAVTPESAMRISAVFASVRLVGCALAALPLHLYEREQGVSGGRRRVYGHPITDLLNLQPSPRWTAASHWEGVGAATQLRGDAFTFIGRDRLGDPVELIPLPWGGVRPKRVRTASDDRNQYAVQDGEQVFGVDQDDMLHFPGFGFNGLRGMSVIQWAARNAAGAAAAMDEYSGRFFAGGAHPSLVLSSDKKMTEDQIKLLQVVFASKYSGAENAHRLPLVLTEGMKVDSLSVSAEDSQLLDARKFQVVDIARAFGVPPHLIGETSASTSWGSGIESMSRTFITFSLQGHLVRIEQELNRKLFPKGDFFLEFNRDALLEADSNGQSKLFRAALGGPGTGPGYMAVDEVRRVKNLPPLGGKCAEVYFPPDKPVKPEKDEEDEDPPTPPTPA